MIVSHQLPIWITRLHVEGRSFLHDPRKRQCTLCSLTSLHFADDRLAAVRYSEPAGDLIPVKDRRRAVLRGRRRREEHRPRDACACPHSPVLLAGRPACSCWPGCSDAASGTRGQGLRHRRRQGHRSVAADERERARSTLAVRTSTGDDGRRSTDFARQAVVVNVWGSWCAPCRAEAPDAGRRVADELDDKASRSSASTSGTRRPATAQAFVRSFERALPALYDPDGKAMLAFTRRRCRRTRSRASWCSTARAGSRPRASSASCPRRPRWSTLVEDVAGGVRAMGELVLRARGLRLAAAGVPVALVAGLVSFFSPCVIPLLPGYLSYATGLSGADLERRAAAAGCSPARCSSCSASPCVFVAARRRCPAPLGAWLIDLAAVSSPRARHRDDPARAGLRRPGPVAPARLRVHGCRRSGWRRRRCSASCSGWAGRRASAPRSAVDPRRCPINEATAGRGALLAVVYALGLGLPFIVAGCRVPADARRVRVGPPPPGLGDPDRRR